MSVSLVILFGDLLLGNVYSNVIHIQVKVGPVISEETSELLELLLFHMSAVAMKAEDVGSHTAQSSPD